MQETTTTPSSRHSQEWQERALKVFPSGVTHDNRYFGDADPVYIDRAQGSHKWDVDGREYVDYWMGHGALLLGHSAPAVVEAVQRQMARGTHYGGSNPLEVEWGELIHRLVPSAERVQFTSSGTEAVMLAVRLARAFTGRPKFLKFQGHFHGWYDAMAAGFHAPFAVPASVGVLDEVLDQVLVSPADLAEVNRLFEMHGKDIACVILEPTGASYGTIPLPPGFLAGLRDIAHANGALLIFDEIVTGFRYAPGGVQEQTGITPDMTTLAKILAGGLPGGAIVGRADVLEALEFRPGDPQWNRYHRVHPPGTFNANPLSAAAGIAMLTAAANGEPQEHAARMGRALTVELNKTIHDLGIEGSCVYGDGPIWHVLLGRGASTNPDGTLDLSSADTLTLREANRPAVKAALRGGLMRRGVDLMSGHAGIMSSAHTQADLDQTVEAFRETLREMRDGGLLG
jgi:glutamate-1-semialdehyde 2,1-aminomutase